MFFIVTLKGEIQIKTYFTMICTHFYVLCLNRLKFCAEDGVKNQFWHSDLILKKLPVAEILNKQAEQKALALGYPYIQVLLSLIQI